MRHVGSRTLLACVALLLGLALCAPGVARGDASLQYSPTIQDLQVEAGDTVTVTVTVTAAGDTPLTVTFRHVDFGLTGDYAVQTIEDDAEETTAFSTRNWFSVAKEQYQVAAGASVQVPVTVRVPKNTPGGTYTGIPLMVGTPPSDGAQIQIPLSGGPLLFIAVEGGDPPKAHVDHFRLPGLVKSGPLTADLRVSNRGDEFFSLQGTLRIDGKQAGDVEIGQQYVLPGQPRTIRRSSGDGPKGSGKGGNDLRIGTKDLGFGRHTAELRLRITPTNATVVVERTFWVVPTWAWIVGGLLALLLIGVLAWLVVWLVGRRNTALLATHETPTAAEPVDPEAGEFDTLLGIAPATGTDEDLDAERDIDLDAERDIDLDAHDDHDAIEAGVDPLLEGFDQVDDYDVDSDVDDAR